MKIKQPMYFKNERRIYRPTGGWLEIIKEYEIQKLMHYLTDRRIYRRTDGWLEIIKEYEIQKLMYYLTGENKLNWPTDLLVR